MIQSIPESKMSEMPVVVITGGTAGVGRATALECARLGFRVAVLARGVEGLEATAAEIRREGGEALAIPTDVADAELVFAAADKVAETWGGIDLWINNAMATMFAPITDVTPEEYERVTKVTYLGQVYGTMAALKHMRRRNSGTIIQVGSALAYRSIPLQAAYCGAKAGVRGFTDSLRTELLHDGSRIKVSMVVLPAVNTPQFDWARTRMHARPQPVPPIYEPEAIAREILRAARDTPRELWIGKSSMMAVLGTMVAPGLLDRKMSGAVSAQMGSYMPEDARPDNLFEPVEGDMGAEGRFGRRAQPGTMALRASFVRAGLAAAGIGAAAAMALAVRGAAHRH